MPVISMTMQDEDNDNQFDIPIESHETGVSTSIALEQVMNELDEKDKEIIRMRYYVGLTQTAIAEKLNMTQVQVSRREKTILKLMRSKLL